jgi:hypothetical protein
LCEDRDVYEQRLGRSLSQWGEAREIQNQETPEKSLEAKGQKLNTSVQRKRTKRNEKWSGYQSVLKLFLFVLRFGREKLNQG